MFIFSLVGYFSRYCRSKNDHARLSYKISFMNMYSSYTSVPADWNKAFHHVWIIFPYKNNWKNFRDNWSSHLSQFDRQQKTTFSPDSTEVRKLMQKTSLHIFMSQPQFHFFFVFFSWCQKWLQVYPTFVFNLFQPISRSFQLISCHFHSFWFVYIFLKTSDNQHQNTFQSTKTAIFLSLTLLHLRDENFLQ